MMDHLSPRKVLCVRDDMPQGDALGENLKAEGLTVFWAADCDAALTIVASKWPDIVILDLMKSPDIAVEICRRLKTQPNTLGIPVILLSSSGAEMDLLRGMNTGADDYVSRPCSMVDLMARVRAQIRRVRPAAIDENLTWEDIVLEPEAYRVYRGGKIVQMSLTELRLLQILLETPGRVWPREQLLDLIWGSTAEVNIRTVDVHMARLRKALCQHGHKDPFRTVRRTGYSLG